MYLMTRRRFLSSTAKQAAVASVAGWLATRATTLHANPLGLPIGCQTWPVRQALGKDFPGMIKELAAAGFQNVELCSPVGYAEYGFGGSSLAAGRGYDAPSAHRQHPERSIHESPVF